MNEGMELVLSFLEEGTSTNSHMCCNRTLTGHSGPENLVTFGKAAVILIPSLLLPVMGTRPDSKIESQSAFN